MLCCLTKLKDLFLLHRKKTFWISFPFIKNFSPETLTLGTIYLDYSPSIFGWKHFLVFLVLSDKSETLEGWTTSREKHEKWFFISNANEFDLVEIKRIFWLCFIIVIRKVAKVQMAFHHWEKLDTETASNKWVDNFMNNVTILIIFNVSVEFWDEWR